jgi:UDP-N-acetylmuramoyl-tripeptide--D-alanyl-D-alanine ligase
LKELRKKVPRLLTVHPTDRKADRRFDEIEDLGLDGWRVRWRGVPMRTPLYGPANLENLVTALAVAEELGVTAKDAARVLPGIKLVAGRSDVLRSGKITVLDETYNANPASVRRSLDLLDGLDTVARKCAVIGTMAELGRRSAWFHADLGGRLAGSSIGSIWLYGRAMKAALPRLAGIRNSGRDVRWFSETDRDELSRAFVEAATTAGYPGQRGFVALVKGSRSCGLDVVVSYAKKKLSLR